MASHAQFSWDDPLQLNAQLSDDERAVRDAAHAYCQERLAPRVLEAFRHDAEVGVKCMLKRGCLTSHACTAGCLCVA